MHTPEEGYMTVIYTDDVLRYVTKESLIQTLPQLDIRYETTKLQTEKLWLAPQEDTNTQTPQANSIVHNQINANYAGWWHATIGSPTISALLSAIQRGALRNVPRLRNLRATTKIY